MKKGRRIRKRKSGKGGQSKWLSPEPTRGLQWEREDWTGQVPPNSNRNPMPDHQLQVGPCLTVGAYLEGSPVNTILDTGAGVSIIGKRFVDLYKRVYGRLPKMDPVSLTIKGVNSAAALEATAIVSFPLNFGPRTVPHKVSAVMVPGWDGEILLGWNNLMSMGITFVLNEEGDPNASKIYSVGGGMQIDGTLLR